MRFIERKRGDACPAAWQSAIFTAQGPTQATFIFKRLRLHKIMWRVSERGRNHTTGESLHCRSSHGVVVRIQVWQRHSTLVEWPKSRAIYSCVPVMHHHPVGSGHHVGIVIGRRLVVLLFGCKALPRQHPAARFLEDPKTQRPVKHGV